MVSAVHQMWVPNVDEMRAQLDFLFGRQTEGWVELVWHDAPSAGQRADLRHAEWFRVDDLDSLVARACEINTVAGQNVYVGVALRRPDCMPGGRSKDADAWMLTAAYTDLDDEGTVAAAAEKTRQFFPPGCVVYTGNVPHARAQMYWRLVEPVTDQREWRALLRAAARSLDGDNSVVNPSRVMRLGGSIAWPAKPGRQIEMTRVQFTKAGRAWGKNELARMFGFDPKVDADEPAPATPVVVEQQAGSLGLGAEKVIDGRERMARDMVFAAFLHVTRATGRVPTAEDLFADVWPVYDRKVDWKAQGKERGPAEIMAKCRDLVQRFARGDLRTQDGECLDSLEAVIGLAASGEAPAAGDDWSAGFGPAGAPAAADDAPFCATDFVGAPPPQQWLVEEWIPLGVIVALYGDGGVGKTLLAQQLLYAAGCGGEWLGMQVPKMRGLGVFCEDDRDELHRRHNAIKASLGYTVGNPFDETWIWPRVGFDNLLVTFDKDNRPTMSAFFGAVMHHVLEKRVGLLVLDTVADLYGGNEIIRAQVNFFIKSTCGAFIRKAKEAGFELTVILLAHPSQSGKESGRGDGGSTAWSNAVRARLYLTKPEDGDVNDRSLSRKKSNYSASGDDTAIDLEWRDGTIQLRGAPDHSMPDLDTCRRMLADIADAWDAGLPLSIAPQTKRGGRYAARVLARRYSLNERTVEMLIEQWGSNRIVADLMCNKHDKIKGLKVVGRLD